MTDWDAEYDHIRPKEEPDCPDCNDTGWGGRRRCAWCNPSPWQQWWGSVTWWFHRLVRRRSHDEAPF